jgi:hypothetical protein
MTTSSELWKQLKDAEQSEKTATAAHDAAELLGSSPAYTAAFEAMADARYALQVAEGAYKAACAAEEAADE